MYIFVLYVPFLWPIATAISMALNPESDSMVGSEPLSGTQSQYITRHSHYTAYMDLYHKAFNQISIVN